MGNQGYLIVGQGLAGTILACTCEKRGIDFSIVDQPALSSCSRIAGGILNPVVMKRMTRSPQAREMLDAARTFYSEFAPGLFHEIPLVKLFGDERDRELWENRARGELQGYIEEKTERSAYSAFVHSPYGYSKVKAGAVLDIGAFLHQYREKWKEKGTLLDAVFEYGQLQANDSIAQWKEKKYAKVIFCEGYLGMHNPWFEEAGFAPAKGEILTVRLPGLGLKEVINKGVYIIPQGNDIYKVGATFSWVAFNDEPEEKARQEILEKLRNLVSITPEVLKQEAGVRPAVVGRMPLLGTHPRQSCLGIFNGLGTKGSLQGPYFAGIFLDHLQHGTELPWDVNVRRFFS